MNTRPTLEQVAREAARYAANEFQAMSSWFTHEDELAKLFLADPAFVCTAEYAINRVMKVIAGNRQMSTRAAQAGGGARGMAYVIGDVVGEWVGGRSTIDGIIDTW